MPLQSYGRICLLVALCLITILLIFKPSRDGLFFLDTVLASHGVANSTLGFQQILVINAPWRTDRKDSLTLAASLTGLSLEWIPGVNASDINEKAFPPGNWRRLPKGNIGSWRAHMDALQMVVERNLSTALILEDDVDWSFMVRNQLSAFALASRRLPDMIAQSEDKTVHHVPSTEVPKDEQKELDPMETAERFTLPLRLNSRPSRGQEDNPYGRDYDILWLGHCGASLPPRTSSPQTSSSQLADRLMLLSDTTVPEPEELKSSHIAPVDQIASLYPAHTRIYHRSHRTLCTLAYAVTQRGARKILYEHGIRNLDKGYDFALSEWCDGLTKNMAERPLCLTSSPPVFSHFWPRNGETGGGKSDIMGIGAGGVESKSAYLVESLRASLEGTLEAAI